MNEEELIEEIEKLRNGIRQHASQKMHDRCWMDDLDLYKLVPGLYTDQRLPSLNEWMENCNLFCRSYWEKRGDRKLRYLASYHDGKLIRYEKACTFTEFVEMNRLEAGQKLLIGNINTDGSCSEVETLFIGDGTVYNQPTQVGEGWDFEHPRMTKSVLSVYTWS